MTYSESLYALGAYAFAINLAGFLVFLWDREDARSGRRRVSQQLLLALALVGGAIGIIAGLRILRHKTEEGPFRTYLRMIVIVQFTVLLALSFPDVRNAIWVFSQ